MTLIQKGDTIYDLKDYGIRTRDLIISSPVPINSLSRVDGSIGVLDNGTTFAERPITSYYRAQSKDIVDFSLLRDEIFNLFRSSESFYLIEKRIPGKRWLVKVAKPYAIPQNNIFGNFDIELISLLGISESISTTQEIEQSGGITYDRELWSYGMGLLHDEESHKYTHNKEEFSIYNAGNVAIHPFEQELKITVGNATSGYKLENETTGDVFEYSGNQIGTLVMDGPNITISGRQALRDTNKEFITLAPGWNHFKQNQPGTVLFDFRFYYT